MTTDAHRNLSAALDYLLHLDRLRKKPVFRLEEHKLPFYHETEFLDLPGVELNQVGGDGEIWLRIRRLHAQKPPRPPEMVRAWVSLVNDPARQPVIHETLTTPGGAGEAAETVEMKLEDYPEVQAAFDAYLRDAWEPWAAEERPRRASIRLYDKLFALHQDVEGAGGAENIEIAWGVGMAIWDHPKAHCLIAYPLFSKTVEIRIDEASIALEVHPTERDPQLHIDHFIALDIPAEEVEARARREAQSSEMTFSPFDPGTYEGVLRFAAGTLDPHGEYWPDTRSDCSDRTLPPAAKHLIVTDTWVLYARKRETNFIVADITRLKEQAEAGAELSGAAALVVTAPPDEVPQREPRTYRGISSPGAGSKGRPVEDLFFPKPFNDEQVAIVDRIAQADGVVVQGPPGTGKTHTIANLICHALASGQRVLVTAQHEAPLAALRDQIPEPLRTLTISLLTSEREGLRQLEASVREIASGIAKRGHSELDAQIEWSRKRLDELHQRIAAIDHELREWGRHQTSEVPYLGDGTRPAALAARMVEDQARFAWFPDELPAEHPPAPVDEAQVDSLRRARRSLGDDLQYLDVDLPDTGELPLPEEFARLHRNLVRAASLQARTVGSGALPPLRDTGHETLEVAEALGEQAAKALGLLRKVSADWHHAARRILASVVQPDPERDKDRDESEVASAPDTDPVARSLHDWVLAAKEIAKRRRLLLGHALELPAGAEGYAPLEDAVARAAQGQRPFGWFGGDKQAKAWFEQIRIGGQKPSEAGHWQSVHEYLEFAREAQRLRARWNGLCEEFGADPLPEAADVALSGMRLAKCIEDLVSPLSALIALEAQVRPVIENHASKVFPEGFDVSRLTEDTGELERLIETLNVHLERIALRAASEAREAVALRVQDAGGPLGMQLRALVARLGDAGEDADQLAAAWGEALEELRRLAQAQVLLGEIERITAAIAAGGAPNWAERLRQPVPEGSANGEDPWLPADWRAAWEWARARAYLAAIDGREAVQKLARERQRAEKDLARETLALVEALTWKRLKENLTSRISAALQAYLSAITKIGRGTGVRAVRHRRSAREAMRNAYQAVPCWIMPHWRVSETLPSQFALFDLIIIDEASQSDAWALPAIVRAKKIVVVGDDKQVSPSDVGMPEAELRMLKQRFLADLPYGDHFLPGGSIYDLASTMFSTDLIRLREHFRCVEPIIAFSNKAFYNNEIKPLRVPKPSERLDPPLMDVFVKGGYREGRKKVNPPEACYIVDEIRAITQNPAMEGRTIGVVSLLGAEQAHYIQERLVSELGEETILRHKIRCGDAMHFQGKEADIVFLSMVAADRIRPDTGRTYEQRYNVAVSRARDRLYVVHSFTREQLNDNDLRARLLDHLQAPLAHTLRMVRDLRELCESRFEEEVFDVLVERGFRVTPQVPVGGYRIDLVVEGADDRRLAVECDGDQYHGQDRWMADLARQRVLERMGWRFWRCWGSSWTAERDACIEDLLATLRELGIEPIGIDGAHSSQYVSHIVVEPHVDHVAEEPLFELVQNYPG